MRAAQLKAHAQSRAAAAELRAKAHTVLDQRAAAAQDADSSMKGHAVDTISNRVNRDRSECQGREESKAPYDGA